MEISSAGMQKLIEYVDEARTDASMEVEFLWSKRPSKDDFNRLVQYLRASSKFEHVPTVDPLTLDITVMDSEAPFRATIAGEYDIREYCTQNVMRVSSCMRKSKVGKVSLLGYDVAFRASRETIIPCPPIDSKSLKLYRKKQRHSFRPVDYPGVRIDLTLTKQSSTPKRSMLESDLARVRENYEVEVELEKMSNLSGEAMSENMLSVVQILMMILKDTEHLLTREEELEATRQYLTMVHPGKKYSASYLVKLLDTNPRSLFLTYAPVTLERPNLRPSILGTTSVLNDYTVTEKADGERMLLYVDTKGRMFMIDNRMNVRSIGEGRCAIHSCLIDGEYVRRDKFGETLNVYAAFDVYFVKGNDVRSEVLIPNRVEHLKEVAKAIAEVRGLSVSVRAKKFFHGEDLFTMARKCYVDNEYPYFTDGIIITPANLGVGADYVNRPANTKRSPFGGSWRKTYKWKPPADNTIDMLTEFVSKPVDGAYVAILSVAYRTNADDFLDPVEVLVGTYVSSDRVIPQRFDTTRLPLLGGDTFPRTKANEPIYSNTIVEYAYEEGAWTPLRVRHDKTDLYRRTKSIANTANSYMVATSIWRSIVQPIDLDMITGRVPVPEEQLSASEDESQYYARTVSRGDSINRDMNVFHNNSIKKRLFRRLREHAGKSPRLLEIACGKAGDLTKWVGYKEVVGVDNNADNLLNNSDGAYRRLAQARQQGESSLLPPTIFLQKDMALPWEDQSVASHHYLARLYAIALGNTNKSELYRSPLETFYNTLNVPFDVISCQFAIHYFCGSEDTLDVFCANVATRLKPGGLFFGTCMDGATVHRKLQRNPEKTLEGVIDGNVAWRIKQLYDPDKFDANPFGNAIDVYIETINRTTTEYLVDMVSLERSMSKHGLEVVAPSTLNLPGASFKEWYKNEPLHKELRRFSFMNRWFVFKKV
jgi:SAM-dependent methyltransferase